MATTSEQGAFNSEAKVEPLPCRSTFQGPQAREGRIVDLPWLSLFIGFACLWFCLKLSSDFALTHLDMVEQRRMARRARICALKLRRLRNDWQRLEVPPEPTGWPSQRALDDGAIPLEESPSVAALDRPRQS